MIRYKMKFLNKKCIIGIDIGGSKTNVVLLKNGKVLKSAKVSTPKNRKEFLEKLETLVRNLISGAGNKKTQGIGCGVAGVLDLKSGNILNAPNLRFLNNFNIKKWLKRKFKLDVKIDNDARCFTRAEYLFGSGRGYKNIVGITLGTGVGGGIIINGQMFYGSFDAAGEIGHTSYYGVEFEDLVSLRSLKKFGFNDPIKAYELAKSGNKKAMEIFKKLGGYLGIGLAHLINTLDPEIIIIGGGMSGASHFFLPQTRKTMSKLIVSPKSIKNVKIIIGKLGENAGAIGATALFYEQQSQKL
ncbi:MAG: ROK family protein [Parcubacteria group bacterium]|nr:ROK family protein [Parcubacteria group bacterium]